MKQSAFDRIEKMAQDCGFSARGKIGAGAYLGGAYSTRWYDDGDLQLMVEYRPNGAVSYANYGPRDCSMAEIRKVEGKDKAGQIVFLMESQIAANA